MIDPRVSEATELLTRALHLLSSTQKPDADVLHRIAATTAENFKLERDLIFRHTRVAEAALARQVAVYLAYQQTRNVTRLAMFFGRARKSILHSLRQTENHLETNRKFRERVFKIRDTLGLKP